MTKPQTSEDQVASERPSKGKEIATAVSTLDHVGLVSIKSL